MKVGFRQSGGFAGLIRGVDLDTSKMDATQARELEELVAASGIQGSASAHSQTARDLFLYGITIDDNNHAASVSFDDSTIPSAVQPLLKYLKAQARPIPLNQAKR